MNNQSIRRIPVLAMALTVLIAATFASTASAEERSGYIVVFKDSVKAPGDLARAHTAPSSRELGFIYRHALKGYSAELSERAVEAVRRDPRVAYVEPDARGGIATQTIPTGIDRIFATANGNFSIDEQDNLRVDADVAVFDTGIDAKHPDLNVVSQVVCNKTSCVPGGSDGHGHGTHVAGTIAALDNGYGVVGVAPGARLWSVRVLNSQGGGELSEYIAGIDWVTAHADEIEVANASLRYWEAEKSKAFEEAIEESLEAGVVHVVAAGNESEKVRYVPGNNPDLITVSALHDIDGSSGTGNDKLASFSNFGPLIDIAAPGVNIDSTALWGSGYEEKSGTSMASPHVAAAAAILAVHDNPESKADVNAIRNAIVAAGNLNWVDSSGDGIKERLLDVSNEGIFNPIAPPEVSTGPVTALGLNGVATLHGTIGLRGAPAVYQFEYGTTTEYGSKAPVQAEIVNSIEGEIEVDQEISGLKPSTTYHYRVVAGNAGGTVYGEDRTFTTPSTAITKPATQVGPDVATLNGEVNPMGLETTYHFEYGLTSEYGTKVPLSPKAIGSGTKGVAVSEAIQGLKPRKTYHFRVVATSKEGVAHSEDMTFMTLAYHAPAYEAETYPAAIAGQQDPGDKLALAFPSLGLTVQCDAVLWDGEISSISPNMALEAEHSQCKAQGSVPTTFDMSGCGYELDVANVDSPYVGDLGLDCAEGKALTIVIDPPTIGKCTVTIPTQALASVAYQNLGEGSARLVEAETDGTGIAYSLSEVSYGCLGGAGSYKNGTMGGSVGLKAVDAQEAQVGFYLSGKGTQGIYIEGKKSEEGALQPKVKAETYPAAIAGQQDPGDKLALAFPSLGLTVQCDAVLWDGEISSISPNMALEAEHSQCKAQGSVPTTFDMSGCGYELDVANVDSPYVGDLGLDCAEGKALTIVIDPPTIGKCTVTIPTQALASVAYQNLGEGSARLVEAETDGTGIAYSLSEVSYGCLGGAGSYKNGTMGGSVVIQAF